MPLVFKIELPVTILANMSFLILVWKLEAFLVNKMFKTQQKYSEFCLVQTKCFSVWF